MARKGGFIGQDGINAPDEPTNVEGSAGDEQVDVSFTSPSDQGGADVTEYRVTDSTGAHGATGSSSPITVTGLTNGTSYTFNVWAINPFGWSSPSDASAGVAPVPPPRVVNAQSTTIEGGYTFFTTSSPGNAAAFGNMQVSRLQFAGLSSETRGVFAGTGGASGQSMEYITIASEGNGATFGNLSSSFYQFAGAANSTRGIWFLANQSSMTNAIEYITIASTGNSVDFGDGIAQRRGNGAGANATRALNALGVTNTEVNTVEYITIASVGNAADFGDLTTSSRFKTAGFSSSTRVFFAGGGGVTGAGSNVIDYFTAATTGNATDFGDLTEGLNSPAASSGGVYGFVFGGYSSVGTINVIQYVTMSSSGNAADWGDLTEAQYENEACSSAHGGIA